MRTMLRGKVTLLFMTLALLLAVPAIALADNVQHNLLNSEKDTRTITTDGNNAGSTTVGYWIEQTGAGNDGQSGCNASDGTPATVKFDNLPSGVSASVSQLSFTACGVANAKDVTFSSTTPGTFTISPSGVTDSGTGTYAIHEASFTLVVKKATEVSEVSGSGQMTSTTAGSATLTAKLSSSYLQEGTLANKTISFRITNSSNTSANAGSATTNNDGVATTSSFSLPSGFRSAGNYTVTATFAEDATYGGAVGTGTLTVAPLAPACTNPAAPVFSGSPDGDNGWYKTIPTVSATSTTSGAVVKYSDAANGTYSETAPTLGEGTTTVYAKAYDSTGNCSSAAVSNTYKVDTIAPSVNPNSVVDSVWRNSSLSQAFTSSDGGSGLASANDASFTLTASDESANSSTPTVVSRTVSDVAGNSTMRSVSAKIDLTDPTIQGSATPAPNSAGWNNTNVAVSFLCNDGLSGIASCLGGTTLSTDGADQSVTGTATDNAGNTKTDTVSGINIDKTAPNVSVTGVSQGGAYTYGAVPQADCDTKDALSGVKTNATVQVTGGNNGFGTFTATCSGASDNADNAQDPVSVKYTVSATFHGWLPPVDGNGGANTLNIGKVGKTYPIKWQLKDASGALISDSAAQLLVGTMSGGQSKVTCGTIVGDSDVLEEALTGNTALRYDEISDQFIYNYKAPSTTGCYAFAIKNADGLTIKQANFDFRK